MEVNTAPWNLEKLKNEIRDILDVSTESYRADTLTMIGGEVPDVVVHIKRSKVKVVFLGDYIDRV